MICLILHVALGQCGYVGIMAFRHGMYRLFVLCVYIDLLILNCIWAILQMKYFEYADLTWVCRYTPNPGVAKLMVHN